MKKELNHTKCNKKMFLKAIKMLGSIGNLADSSGIPVARLYEIKRDVRSLTPINALKIELATFGKITRNQLLPYYDWSKIPG